MFLPEDHTEVEAAFRAAYTKRHGKRLKDFTFLGDGKYTINGIEFSEIEVAAMLDTLENEIAEINRGLVTRLIRFFGGKRLG